MNGRHPATKNDGLAASAVLVADCAAAIADSASCSLLAARSRCSAFGKSWISSFKTSVTPPRPVMSNSPMNQLLLKNAKIAATNLVRVDRAGVAGATCGTGSGLGTPGVGLGGRMTAGGFAESAGAKITAP